MGVMAIRNDRHKQIADLLSREAAEQRQLVTRAWNRKQAQVMARNQLFMNSWQQMALTWNQTFLPTRKPPKLAPNKRQRRVLTLLLSDLHFGSLLDHREVPYQYGPTEEARRIAAVIVEAVEYKVRYREHTVLRVNLAGDLFQGVLHDPRDGAPLAAQAMATATLLAQAITYASAHFPEVYVEFTPGNHGRDKSRHADRAIHQKWDGIETMTYHNLSGRLAHLGNVHCGPIHRTPYYTYDEFQATTLVTHGDTVLKVGYPGRNINIDNIRKQLNHWMVTRDVRFRVVAVGHVHIRSSVALPEGVHFISNGCLVPPDNYAVSIGSHGVQCGQMMWESTRDYPVGDERFVRVDETIDKDPYYDKIVKPFEY